MIDYSKMRASICTYDDMYREMEQGVSRALTEYIIQMAEPFEAGGVVYVDRKAVDRCARRMFSSRKQERSRRIESERKLEEMEKRIAQDTKVHSQTVSMLNGRIAELSRQCSETVEGIGDEQPNSGASTSKAGLRKELDDARKELERLRGQLEKEKEEKDALKGSSTSRTISDMGIRIATLEKCFDEKTRASEQQAKRLQEALDSAKDSASARNGSSALDSIPEYYSGEIWDFIGHLARQRLAVLPDEDASSYRRERDLCEMLSAAMPDSGVQRSLSADIEEAVRMKFDKNLNAGLLSLGFVLESSNSHEKFVLKGAGDAVSSRVSIIFSKTPSDRKARAAATAGLLRMLTFGGSGAKESQQAEGKEI